MVPPTSHKVSRVSWYFGSRSLPIDFAYEAFTLFGWLSQNHSAIESAHLLRSITPACTHAGLGSFLFARRYSGNRIFSFSSSGYLDVSVPRVPSTYLWIQYAVTEVCSARFPHSEITGSKDICSSPMLIAAYHVFHRLLVPRHPPYALYSLIIINRDDLSWFIIHLLKTTL